MRCASPCWSSASSSDPAFTASRSDTRFSGRPLLADEVLEAVRQRPGPDGRVERQDGLRVDRRLGCWRLLRQQPRSDNGDQHREREDSRGGARKAVEHAHDPTLLREGGPNRNGRPSEERRP